jgi:transposase
MGLLRAGLPSSSSENAEAEERTSMEHYVGLDVSLELTSICVVDGKGKCLWQGKCASTPEAIAAAVRARAPRAVRVGLESGPLSIWHWHELKRLGLPVVCLDARHAKAALSLQLNKSDRNDALGLAQIVRTGWYREVAVKSFDSQVIRTLLTTRAQLVRMRTDLANQIRGVLKPFGLIAGKGGGRPFMGGCGRWPQTARWRMLLKRCSRHGKPSARRSPASTGASWPWLAGTNRCGV